MEKDLSDFEQLRVDRATLHGLLKAEFQYLCPLYQRPYVWKSTRSQDGNLDMLWSDIDTVTDGVQHVRFLGAVVFDVAEAGTSSQSGERWIIDGQQRLTTLYLAMTALARLARDVDAELFDDTVRAFLGTSTAKDRGTPKLRPTIPDTNQFNHVLRDMLGDKPELLRIGQIAVGPASGALTEAYDFHLKQLRERAELYDGTESEFLWDMRAVLLEQLEFAEIYIGNRHDPTEVFDRLNRGGEPLGLVDLVRNVALKPVRKLPDDARQVYDHEWRPFEDDFIDPGEDDGDKAEKQAKKDREAYLWPLALIHDDSITKSRVFRTLTDRWDHMDAEADDEVSPRAEAKRTIKDLRSYTAEYMAVTHGVPPAEWPPELRRVVSRTHEILPTVTYPYIMRLLKAVHEDQVAAEDAVAALEVLESFLVRRGLLGMEPTGLHAVFKKLWAWTSGKADAQLVRSKLVTKTVKFPNDVEVSAAIMGEPLYKRKIDDYVIGEYERSLTGDDELPVAFTIDHVLPQTPDGEWLKLFTDEERDAWTHRWANLVPLRSKANSERGRASWNETREKLSTAAVYFASTREVLDNHEVWSVDALTARSQNLVAFALERWPDQF